MELLLPALCTLLLVLAAAAFWPLIFRRPLPGLEGKKLPFALVWLGVWALGGYLGQSELDRPLAWGLLVGGVLALNPRLFSPKEDLQAFLRVPEFRAMREMLEERVPQVTGRPARLSFFRMMLLSRLPLAALIGAFCYFSYRWSGGQPAFLRGFLISYAIVSLCLWLIMLALNDGLFGERQK